ncbi:hypothetical protein ACTXT7_016744 [Hymenolepis weldensis]
MTLGRLLQRQQKDEQRRGILQKANATFPIFRAYLILLKKQNECLDLIRVPLKKPAVILFVISGREPANDFGRHI